MQLIASLPMLLALFLPGLALIFTYVHHARVDAGRSPLFRPLPGLPRVHQRLDELAEDGGALHIATGNNQIGTPGPNAATLAGLSLTQRLATATVQRGGRLAITSGDSSAHVAARGIVRQAFNTTGFNGDYEGGALQLTAQQTPLAYAASVAARGEQERFAAHVLTGEYGSEVLLAAAPSRSDRVPQVGAVASLAALPAVVLTSDVAWIGEDAFAAEAYLATNTASQARLLTQDTLRRAILILLLLGLAYQGLNVGLNLGWPSL